MIKLNSNPSMNYEIEKKKIKDIKKRQKQIPPQLFN
jgi:hypothetical protein